MKKIELLFYKTTPSEKNKGLKHVLWEVTGPDNIVTYDWGFAQWDGQAWEPIEVPAGFTAQIHSWANCVNPDLLLKEPSKIIRL